MDNPYQAPNTEVVVAEERYNPKFFALNGRIGRVRYFFYSFSLLLLFQFALGMVLGVMNAQTNVTTMNLVQAGSVLFLGLIVITMAVRRFHDINRSAWFVLLMLIPLLNILVGLVLLFWPGTKGTNNYGFRPTPNSTMLIIASVGLGIIFVGSIGVAVLLPVFTAGG